MLVAMIRWIFFHLEGILQKKNLRKFFNKIKSLLTQYLNDITHFKGFTKSVIA
jgi:hypothetical protein